MLGLNIGIKKDTLFVRLRGELDESNCEALKIKLSDFIEKYSINNVCFNLGRLTFIDSSGIGVILGRYRQICNRGELIICEARGDIKRIVKLSGLEKIVKLKETEENVRCYLKIM